MVALNDAGGTRWINGPTRGGGALTPDRRSVLLYDPRRYDTDARQGEFFMIEWREPVPGTYEANVAGRGFYVWQCQTDANGNTLNILHPGTSDGWDASVNTFGAPSGVRGGNTPWTSGTVSLRYIDGTDAGIVLRIGSGSNEHVIEWTQHGMLTGRIDTGSTSAYPGGWFSIDGDFPAMPASLQLVSHTSGAVTVLTPPTWGSSRLLASVPRDLRRGSYSLYLVNGFAWSAPWPFTVR